MIISFSKKQARELFYLPPCQTYYTRNVLNLLQLPTYLTYLQVFYFKNIVMIIYIYCAATKIHWKITLKHDMFVFRNRVQTMRKQWRVVRSSRTAQTLGRLQNMCQHGRTWSKSIIFTTKPSHLQFSRFFQILLLYSTIYKQSKSVFH